MRYLVIGIGALVAAIAATAPSFAEPPPWCLEGNTLTREYVTDCSYRTLAQCKAAGGDGAAMCYPNKLLQWRALEQSRKQPVPQRPRRERRD